MCVCGGVSHLNIVNFEAKLPTVLLPLLITFGPLSSDVLKNTLLQKYSRPGVRASIISVVGCSLNCIGGFVVNFLIKHTEVTHIHTSHTPSRQIPFS